VIGVLPGEGIGPEVIDGALRVLKALESATGETFEVTVGGTLGCPAGDAGGDALSAEAIAFCRRIFARGGAVMNGPVGGRYVYDLRRAFNLFCKLSPIRTAEELLGAIRFKPSHVRGVDLLVVREACSGVYQGTWGTEHTPEGRVARHAFSYSEREVRRILRAAARIAQSRRGGLTVVFKEAGMPAVSGLWRDCAREIADGLGVHCSFQDVDCVAYRLLQHPRDYDVVVAPNLLGDVLTDLGGVLLGSRGLSYAGSFSSDGAAVYSTNHGAARDLAGTDRANPAAQILSLAMMLRESFGRDAASRRVEAAVTRVWSDGWRTADLAEPGCRVVGTRELSERIADAVLRVPAAEGRPAAATRR
jgi:3-isopropylmalate dehydrogenase